MEAAPIARTARARPAQCRLPRFARTHNHFQGRTAPGMCGQPATFVEAAGRASIVDLALHANTCTRETYIYCGQDAMDMELGWRSSAVFLLTHCGCFNLQCVLTSAVHNTLASRHTADRTHRSLIGTSRQDPHGTTRADGGPSAGGGRAACRGTPARWGRIAHAPASAACTGHLPHYDTYADTMCGLRGRARPPLPVHRPPAHTPRRERRARRQPTCTLALYIRLGT